MRSGSGWTGRVVVGNPGEGGLMVSPFSERKPGYGRHRIEYRSIDAAGNVGPTKSVTVTLLP